MISVDTNILLPAVNADHPENSEATAFLASLQNQTDVAISEFVLLELYGLLRNPAVLSRPLKAEAAVDVCEAFRQHPSWQIIGFPPDSLSFHQSFWPKLREPGFARRRAYDWRIALSLVQQGVTDFATINLKDYQGFGFKRVWNPLQKDA